VRHFAVPSAGLFRSRLAVSALAGALSISLLGPWLSPLPASAQPAVQQQETGDLSRPDSVSASLTARSSGRPVEDLSQRTEASRVFANPDSTWTLDSYTSPQSTQQSDGSWAEVNNDLGFGPEGVTAPAGAADITLSDGEKATNGVADLAQFKSEDSKGKPAQLTLGWEGDLPKPVLDGATAVYPDAAESLTSPEPTTGAPTAPAATAPSAPGADVRVETTRTGFSHTVTLPQKPAEALELRFPLELSAGLKVRIAESTGTIEVVDADGKTVFFAPKPMMWDSQRDEHSGLNAHETPVPARIDTTGTVPVLVLTPAQEFLEDPTTQYPVTVDPTWSTPVTGDTWVQTDTTSPQDGSGELRVGTWDAGVHKARSYMVFPTSALNGKKILDAKIQMNNFWSYSCTAANIYAQRLTSGWNTTTLIWGNQPSATATGQQPLSTAKGFSSSCPAGNVYFPLTPIVQTWADTPSTNLGVRLVAGNEGDSNTWRRYTSANASTGDAATEPHLQVTYNSHPNTAGSATTDAAQTTYWTNPATGVETRYVNTRKPKLSAIITDPDGGTVKGLWTLTTGSTQTWNQIAGTTVSSGGRSILTPGTSTPSLTEGATYSIDIWGNDGSLSSKTAYRHTMITVDSTPPSAPTISANNLTNGQWTSPKPSSNRFTFTGPSSDTAKFQYSIDGKSFVDAAAAGTLDWVAEGSHTLAVRAVDRAGNISSATTFTYGAGSAALTSPAAGAKTTDSFTVIASAPTAGTGTVTPPCTGVRPAAPNRLTSRQPTAPRPAGPPSRPFLPSPPTPR
jgi:hypothetical protein